MEKQRWNDASPETRQEWLRQTMWEQGVEPRARVTTPPPHVVDDYYKEVMKNVNETMEQAQTAP